MSEPIVFISRNRVKEGLLEDFLRLHRDSLPLAEGSKPGTVVQLAYVDGEGRDLVILRLFADADALDQQLQGADERSKSAYQFIEPASVEIYGAPNEYALEMINRVAGAGIEVRIYPRFCGGFTRLSTSGILV